MTPRYEIFVAVRLGIAAGLKFLLGVGVVFVAFFVAVLLVLRVVDPPTSAVMLRDRLAGARIEYRWAPLSEISPNLIRSVISSEDARFCSHHGIDLIEMGEALRTAERDGLESVRGASTITMQVAKNLFLWTGRSFARKALELAITPLIELTWPKRRIIEVYLNIAQWGPGIFGADAAARHHFKRAAIDLSEQQASLLTAALPAPSLRNPAAATRSTRRIADRIKARMRPGNVAADCVLDPFD